jgi:hypothetical protein
MPDRCEHAKNISRAVMKPIRTRYVLGFWVSDDLDLTEGHRLDFENIGGRDRD